MVAETMHLLKHKWIWFGLMIITLALSPVMVSADALTYLSPWGGADAAKETNIVNWAMDETGIPVDLQHTAGGVQGVIEQVFLYQATGIPVDIVWNHQSMHHQFDRAGAWLIC